MILLAAAYGLPLFGILIPSLVILVLAALFVLLGILAGRYILAFDAYREMYQPLLAEQRQKMDKVKNAAKDKSLKGITYEGEVQSQRRGFEYLNELFLKRHRKILWGPSSKVTVVSFGILIVLGIAVVVNPAASEAIHHAIPMVLPYLIFGMYAINRGTQFTQALFMNCDRSLLSYSFFKEPKNIIKLFVIRLREIMKVNLLPASVIGLGTSALLYLSGGASNPWHYLVIPVYIMALSIFFSVHYLMLYYLMQPYNVGTEMKSSTYKVVIWLTYIVCYMFIWLKIEFNFFFGIVAIVFCIIYSAVACVLVYKLAAQTFRIRN